MSKKRRPKRRKKPVADSISIRDLWNKHYDSALYNLLKLRRPCFSRREIFAVSLDTAQISLVPKLRIWRKYTIFTIQANIRSPVIIKGQRAPHRPTQTHEDISQYNRAREKDRAQREEEWRGSAKCRNRVFFIPTFQNTTAVKISFQNFIPKNKFF